MQGLTSTTLLSTTLTKSAGGALARVNTAAPKAELIRVPPSSLGPDMAGLFLSGKGADFTFLVEGESMKVCVCVCLMTVGH